MHMQINRSFLPRTAGAILLSIILLPAVWMAAQTPQSRPSPSPAVSTSSGASDEEVSATREQLFKLLRLSPKLTSVVARDPSLLSDQEYVSRNNPELARFLQQHPEIARNPEFYLFSSSRGAGGREQRLEQVVGPDLGFQGPYRREHVTDYLAFMAFLAVFGAALWLLRLFVENRRWGRTMNVQAELHNKLLDKFGNSQELLTYMSSETGKRFLEAAPASASDLPSPAKLAFSRILLPLQFGVVLFLLGAGCFSLQGDPGIEGKARVFGILGVTGGLGFIISAGFSYLLAWHLGLLPKRKKDQASNGVAASQQP
jgi:hypothetical protein